MLKLLTGLSAALALALSVSAGSACDFHAKQVTASAPVEEVVAMSTPSPSTAPSLVSIDESAVVTDCPPGKECKPVGK
jgi:hypothetical protein